MRPVRIKLGLRTWPCDVALIGPERRVSEVLEAGRIAKTYAEAR